jgi:hypothetical protein
LTAAMPAGQPADNASGSALIISPKPPNRRAATRRRFTSPCGLAANSAFRAVRNQQALGPGCVMRCSNSRRWRNNAAQRSPLRRTLPCRCPAAPEGAILPFPFSSASAPNGKRLRRLSGRSRRRPRRARRPYSTETAGWPGGW